ncbi:glucose-inhibited division protein A [Nostoc sp. FACHB-973]|nr:glucose-inhibited division protein A [Nostoc sp. FACHB-973]
MSRSKLVAILTGAISVILAIAYLILVQLLDYRDMKPAPISQFDQAPVIISNFWQIDKIAKV